MIYVKKRGVSHLHHCSSAIQGTEDPQRNLGEISWREEEDRRIVLPTLPRAVRTWASSWQHCVILKQTDKALSQDAGSFNHNAFKNQSAMIGTIGLQIEQGCVCLQNDDDGHERRNSDMTVVRRAETSAPRPVRKKHSVNTDSIQSPARFCKSRERRKRRIADGMDTHPKSGLRLTIPQQY